VFRRGAVTLNKERARLLREAEEKAGGTPPVRDILHALIAPAIRWSLGSDRLALYNQFMAVARTDGPPEMRELVEKDVAHLQRFVLPLARALPHLPQEEVYWRLHFAMGVLHSVYTDLRRLETLSGGLCTAEDADALIDRAVDYALAGFEAPYKPR